MSDASSEEPEAAASPPGDDPMAEFRAAAGAVVASLRELAVAAERLVEDPEVFESVVASGKSVFDAFAAGFAGQPRPSADDDADAASGSGTPAES